MESCSVSRQISISTLHIHDVQGSAYRRLNVCQEPCSAASAKLLPTMLCTDVLQARKNGTCPWLRPDGKTQVTVEYRNDNGAMVPLRVHTILISTQHSPDVTNDFIHKELMEHVIKPVVPSKYMDNKTIFHLNPSGTGHSLWVHQHACLACCMVIPTRMTSPVSCMVFQPMCYAFCRLASAA